MSNSTNHIDRTIVAVAKLGLFSRGELKLNERQFEGLFDQVLEFLEELNNHKYRFGRTIPVEAEETPERNE